MYPARPEMAFCRAGPEIADHRHFNPGLLPFDAFRFVAFDHFGQTYVRRANAKLAKQKHEPLKVRWQYVDVYQQASIRMFDVKVAQSAIVEVPDRKSTRLNSSH